MEIDTRSAEYCGWPVDLVPSLCGGFFTYTTVITHPNYPNCNFNIEVEYFICPNSSNPTIMASDYTIISYDCTQFDNDLQAATLQGDLALFNFVQNFDNLMLEALEISLLSQIAVNIPTCGSGYNVTIAFITASCYTICTKEITIHGFTLTSFQKISCLDSGCCTRSTFYCIDPDTNITVSGTRIDPFPNNDGNCNTSIIGQVTISDSPFSTPNVDLSNCTYLTNCTYSCGK